MSVLARDLACKEAVELVTSYLDDAMSRRDRRRFERHLAKCDGCTAYLAQVRAVVAELGTVGPEDLDDATLTGLVELYRRYQGDDAGTTASR